MTDQTPVDEQWVRRFQERAGEVTPTVRVDPDRALRAGRRHRTVRRATLVGSVAVVALVVALGAQPAIDVVRGWGKHRGVAADQVQPVVREPSAAQVEEQAQSLALMAERNALTDPPEVTVERWVERGEEPFVKAECLGEAGFPADEVSSEGYEHTLHVDQESAFALADYVCTARFPVLRPVP
jgi:hypothetical protein